MIERRQQGITVGREIVLSGPINECQNCSMGWVDSLGNILTYGIFDIDAFDEFYFS
jgi:hypothetical protein